MVYVAIAIAAVILVSAALLIKTRRRSVIEPIDIDVLGLKDVIGFFRQPETMNLLKQSQDRLAVAIKEKHANERTNVILTLFDKVTNTAGQPLAVYSAKEIDIELMSLFGDKDMLVIK